jgi:hypothetical protein
MTAAGYATDLSNHLLAENTGTWSEFTGYTAAGTPAAENDYYIQGSYCESQSANIKSGLGSIAADLGTTFTTPLSGGVLMWQYHAAPGTIATDTNGGLRMIVGTDISNFRIWYTGGSDWGVNPYGGWNNVVVDPRTTGSIADVGTFSTYRWVGSGFSAIGAVAKGNPHAMDAVRYGRGILGISGGTTPDSPATFTGAAAINDASTARYGLLKYASGSYLMKGQMIFGYTGACHFEDSNKVILIDDTRRVNAGFNSFLVKIASSKVYLTAVSISALGTNAKGRWQNFRDADVRFTNCTFTDMDRFELGSNTIAAGSVWRRCNTVYRYNASISNCIFDATTNANGALQLGSTSVVSDDDPENNSLDGCTFLSDNTGHGLWLTKPYVWYYLNDTTFTGYASVSGSTGNEAVYNNSGGHIWISHSGTAGTLSIRNSTGGSVTLVSGQATLTLTGIKAGSEVVILAAGTTNVLASEETVNDGDFSYTYTYVSNTYVDIVIHNVAGYQYFRIDDFLLDDVDASVPISQVIERNYIT